MTVAALLERLLGPSVPVAFRAYDGSTFGPRDAAATVVLRSPDALRRILAAPNELGFGRAYVAGDLDVEGDIFAVLALRTQLGALHVGPREAMAGLGVLGFRALLRRPPIPREEARLRGRRHSRARDAEAIAFHYDLSNAFYAMLLGPSLTYSCAVWLDGTSTLEDAQAAKHELVCRKLGLEPGMRLLDVGCGWGGMLIHAAREHGVRAVGVTLSREQAELAAHRVADAGLDGLVEVRFADYRDVDDGPFDAISSIGMFEHVGRAQLETYFASLHGLLRPEGRLLNHGIARVAGIARAGRGGRRLQRASPDFVNRYVFPDGELEEVGVVVTTVQHAGFEVRHVENLREHYARTLRCWLANLERGWATAVAEIGEARARVWRLYLAVATVLFEGHGTEVHQVLAVRTAGGRSGFPLATPGRWDRSR
ncbi:MAG TPA: cyclopropane-fatty-acyl-phospholipid synthase family protein [Acidimicrobiia bacterium]|nr:cyclopropane-fatty-acyl-phospholipid synthase family protein [Acidimicrobiia bacterium]